MCIAIVRRLDDGTTSATIYRDCKIIACRAGLTSEESLLDYCMQYNVVTITTISH